MCQILNRTKAALWASVDTFFTLAKNPTIWTFTSEKVRSVQEAFEAWRKLSKALWHFGLDAEGNQTIFGIMVAEMHPGGHGVHFHVLLNRRLNAHAVRRRATKFGFFWIDARAAYNHPHKPFAGYLGKYLAKADRPECLKGRKLWSAFGKWGATRCKDIVIETEFTRAFHHRRRMIEAEATIAAMSGREYRKEHNLETMAHAQEHVFLVCTLQREPIKPEAFIFLDLGPKVEVARGWEDWASEWHDIAPNVDEDRRRQRKPKALAFIA